MNAFPIKAAFLAASLLAANAATAQGVVTTVPLGSGFDPAAAGALDPGAADLPPALWSGADRAEIARLAAALPARISSPTLADLARRTMAVAAPPPAGAATAPGFAETRAAALLRMGRPGLAARLLAGVPKSARNEAADLMLMNASLLNRDAAGACAVARDRSGRAETAEFAKAAAFCEALAGDKTRAQFGAALVAEKDPDDAAYFELLDVMTREGVTPGRAIQRLKAPTPLHRAMMAAAGVPPTGLPASDAADAVAIEAYLATSPSADPALRTDAAWRALKANAVDVEATRQLFLAAASAGVPGQYAAAVRAEAGPDRAIALARLLEAGSRDGAAGPTAELARPLLMDLLALASGPDIAGRIARGLLLAAEPRGARRWLASMEAGSAVPGAPEAALKLAQLIALATGADAKPFTGPEAVLWIGAIQRAGTEAAPAKIRLLAALREALGLPVPPALAGASQAGAAPPPVAALDLLPLETAAADSRVGETILRAIALATSGETAAAPFRMAAAAKALADVGLADAARLLATEAAIAGGL